MNMECEVICYRTKVKGAKNEENVCLPGTCTCIISDSVPNFFY